MDFTISASGNCAGTPANCGTSSNRNGDRDTTWPGLQVDEGDQITFTVQANNVPSGSSGLWSLNATISGSAWTTNDLTVQVGQSILGSPQTITLAKVLPETSERYRYLAVSDGTVEVDETITFSLTSVATAIGGTTNPKFLGASGVESSLTH